MIIHMIPLLACLSLFLYETRSMETNCSVAAVLTFFFFVRRFQPLLEVANVCSVFHKERLFCNLLRESVYCHNDKQCLSTYSSLWMPVHVTVQVFAMGECRLRLFPYILSPLKVIDQEALVNHHRLVDHLSLKVSVQGVYKVCALAN